MVSITVAVPEDIRTLMKKYPEVNWSGLVRKSIVQNAKELESIEEMKRILESEKEITNWSVKLQHSGRSGRLESLKKKGLI